MTRAAPDDERDRVGPYRVLAAIGAGGSARIDLARLERAYGFERHVVIKRPLEHLRADDAVAASLRQEARLGGLLRHPNLVAVLDAGVHDGYDYLVLEYVHGAPLRRVMQAGPPDRVRPLPIGVALGIAIEIARGLHHAHELTDRGTPLGLVHRDVSPANVLVGVDGAIKLADFGIAKETQVSTLSGSMRGTVTYMAPEQCQGHPFDRRADVFSLGVILFELLTHRRLFHADNDVASLHRVLSGVVPRPRALRPELSKDLEDIVLTAVAHDAARRFTTAGELAAALEAVAARDQLPISARWIARAIELVLGRPAEPWRVRPPVAVPAMFAEEASLVDVIASLEGDADEDDEPTVVDDDWGAFVPADAGAEIGDAAASEAMMASVVTAPPPRQRRRGRAMAIAMIAGVALAGAGVAIAVEVAGRDGERKVVAPAPGPAPVPTPRPGPTTMPPPSPAPTTPPVAVPETVTENQTETETGTGIETETGTETGTEPEPASGSGSHHHRKRDRTQTAAPSTPPPTTPEPPAAGSGSAKHDNPVWGPDIFLPGDSHKPK